MHKPEPKTEAQLLHERLQDKYPRLNQRVASIPVAPIATASAMNDNEPDVIGPKYVYEGNPGKIRVDGVERDVGDLSDAEKVTAGEQFLKHYALVSGTSVAEVRKQLSEIAAKATQEAMLNTVGKVNVKPARKLVSMGGGKQMVVNQAGNRKERRKEAALARRK